MSARITQSVEDIVAALYQSNFAEQNVDLQVDIVGALNYTPGMKLRLSFCDAFGDEDVDEWHAIARSHGATGIRTRVNTSSGVVDLNIEYKRSQHRTVGFQWILRSVLVLMASWSYHQLHQLESSKYPWPTEWFA
tara:strand:- start:750 stop:1154 length:405 start_codon:yes stop_codon:yes gene_type:complete